MPLQEGQTFERKGVKEMQVTLHRNGLGLIENPSYFEVAIAKQSFRAALALQRNDDIAWQESLATLASLKKEQVR